MGYYFSFTSLLPIINLLEVFIFHNTILQNFVIPSLVSIVPLSSFALEVHFPKSKIGVSDLDAVIFLLLFGFFMGPLVSVVAYMTFGIVLGRVSIEDVKSR